MSCSDSAIAAVSTDMFPKCCLLSLFAPVTFTLKETPLCSTVFPTVYSLIFPIRWFSLISFKKPEVPRIRSFHFTPASLLETAFCSNEEALLCPSLLTCSFPCYSRRLSVKLSVSSLPCSPKRLSEMRIL